VEKLCYLDDMLSVDGDADAAAETRIRIGWNKFRHLVHCSYITDSEREIVQQLCVKYTVSGKNGTNNVLGITLANTNIQL